MIPRRHPTATRTLTPPEGWEKEDGHCSQLAVADVGEGMMQSVWEPTPQDLACLNAGGRIVLTVLGNSHPPVAIETWLPPDE